MNNEVPKVENLITEADLCELFGCDKKQLARLRHNAGLPFIGITKTSRLYLESDVMTWLLTQRKISPRE